MHSMLSLLIALIPPHSWRDEEDHTLTKGISPKVNLIAWLEFELSYYKFVVQSVFTS